MIKVKENLANK